MFYINKVGAESVVLERWSRDGVVTIILCGLVMILDGYDTMSIAYVAPVIAREWGIGPAALGIVFSSGLLGVLLGNLASGLVADRFGRRVALIPSVALFGVCALLTVAARNVPELMALRLVTGFGLGSAIPNLLALSAEWAPPHRRTTAAGAISCGLPVGAVLCSLFAANTIEALHWQGVFYIGGILPLMLVPALYLWLPESLEFSEINADRRSPKLTRQKKIGVDALPVRAERRNMVVVELFREGRALSTMLLWLLYFTSLLTYYSLSNWMPVLLRDADVPLRQAILYGALLNLAGVPGTVIVARFIDRRRTLLPMVIGFLIASASIACLGFTTASVGLLSVGTFLVGFFVVGLHSSVSAAVANFYPTDIRTTGIGWGSAVGRGGSLVGPVLGGYLLGAGLSTGHLFMAAAVPPILAALIVWLFVREQVRRQPSTDSSTKERPTTA